MEVHNSFSEQHIEVVLKNASIFSDKSIISFSVYECKSNQSFKLLNVEGDGVEHKYVLAKIPKNLETEGPGILINSKVIYPVFIVENDKSENYGAFQSEHGMEHFVSPEHNNAECLKAILTTLAEYAALQLASGEVVEKPNDINLSDITDAVMSLNFFKDLDKAKTKQPLENLQLAVNKLLESNLLVKSIGCHLTSSVYVNRGTNQSIFLSLSSTQLVPVAYDALLYIFVFSNEKFRQKYFKDLVVYYFNSLKTFLRKLPRNVDNKITKRLEEQQVKVLLPVVKFKIASCLLEKDNSLNLQEILTNISYFIKYPLINQEDIYEVTKNKLGSHQYELLNYSLIELSEKNGHLGEYFHLDIKVKVQEKEQELQLFAKFLKISTDLFQDLMDKGPSKKEDFFYKTLIPLYAENGLESLLDFAPRCYLSRDNWLLVLDDLSREGYVGLKPNAVLNYDGLRATVENLAKFHASTIILEEILTEKSGKPYRLDEHYGEYLEEAVLICGEGNDFKAMYDNTLESLYYIVEKFPEVTGSLNLSEEEIRARLKDAFLSVFSKVKNSDKIRNVINHGDMYVGNMVFNFDENKLITKGVLVDFQLLRYVSPTYDLLFFLFENSTKETRDKYLKKLIKDYYDYIRENIRKFNFDPDVIFPKETFDADIKYMLPAGVIGAFMYAHVIHIDSDFREEIFHDQEKFTYYMQDHKKELIDLSWKCKHYRTILKGLVEDIVDNIRS